MQLSVVMIGCGCGCNCVVWCCNCGFWCCLLQWFVGGVGWGLMVSWEESVFLGGWPGEGDGEVDVALGVAGIPWEGYVVSLVG